MSEEKKSEVVDISTLAGKFKNRRELQEYAEKLFNAFKESVLKLQKLEEENKHLKELLEKSALPIIKQEPIAISVPDEQAIAEIQLKKLKQIALERDLTLDETKRFDLLTKNLFLSKGKPTGVIKTSGKKIEEEMSEAELVEIAKKDE